MDDIMVALNVMSEFGDPLKQKCPSCGLKNMHAELMGVKGNLREMILMCSCGLKMVLTKEINEEIEIDDLDVFMY